MNIDYISMLDNDRYYVLITSDLIVNIYSINNLTQGLFQYDLNKKSEKNLFSFQTYHSNIIIFMFYDQFIFLKIKFSNVENLFNIQSEQILSVINRDIEYTIEFTPDKKYLILKHSLNLENDSYLYDLRIFICDNQYKITSFDQPITYTKSKIPTGNKIVGFRTYEPLHTRSELYIAYQGLILHVHLPSNVAELDIRSDYHCWMRHSLALYNQTTEKSNLSTIITSLAIDSSNDSCLASGSDDGSIILWYLIDKYIHEVLESPHIDQVKQTWKKKTRTTYI